MRTAGDGDEFHGIAGFEQLRVEGHGLCVRNGLVGVAVEKQRGWHLGVEPGQKIEIRTPDGKVELVLDHAAGSLTITTDADVVVKAGGDAKVEAQGALALKAGRDLQVTAGGSMKLQATGEMAISGAVVKLN